MKITGKTLCVLSIIIFIIVTIPCVMALLERNDGGIMNCSTKAIMRFENMDNENVNGNIHFSFAKNGQGSIVVEGYTDSAAGWLYLQRYVKLNYTSRRVSPTIRQYHISQWESSAFSIDESPNVIFDYFMREMSDSHDGLFLNAQLLNDKTLLLSSLNSPLFICTLKPGSKFN